MRKAARDKYRRGDVRLGWRGATAVADYRDASGKRRRAILGTGLSDLAAREALDRFCEARAAIQTQQAKSTVKDLWDKWLADRAKDKLRNDIYEANWASLAPHFANRYPANITADDCRQYAKARFDAGRAPATVNTELVRLRACLRWAESEGLIDRVPRIWTPSRGPSRKRSLSLEEAQRLITAAAHGDHHIHVFMVLAFTTGARHAAILDLTWDRVDFDAGTIQYDEAELADPMSKRWKKGRATVLMGKAARSVLEAARTIRQSQHVVEHGGRRLKTIRGGFANAVKRAGLPDDITPHTIRHTVATWLQERGIDAEMRARLLGHTDSRTTETVYSHAGPQYLSTAVESIDLALDALPTLDASRTVAATQRAQKKRRLSRLDKPAATSK